MGKHKPSGHGPKSKTAARAPKASKGLLLQRKQKLQTSIAQSRKKKKQMLVALNDGEAKHPLMANLAKAKSAVKTVKAPSQNLQSTAHSRLFPEPSHRPSRASASDAAPQLGRKRSRGEEDAMQVEATSTLKRSRTREEKRKRTIDEWDSGAQERLEASTWRQKPKHGFDPKPATFEGESEESRVKKLGQKMGDLAGPLLVSLWDADRDLRAQSAPKPKPKPAFNAVQDSHQHQQQRVSNPFAALASDDEEQEEELAAPAPPQWSRPAVFKASAPLKSDVASFNKPRPLFAPPTFVPPPAAALAPPQPTAAPGSNTRVLEDDEVSL
jgi:hypothetical protein